MILTRRRFLASASMLSMVPAPMSALAATPVRRAEAVPARYVRLKPSIFADAMAANRRYLLSLDPERLLHNFYLSAGLPPNGELYGGWESQAIAGHTLGHWLSACALFIANIPDPNLSAALDQTLGSMARIQAAEGDGHLGGITAPRDGRTVPGKVIFEEVRRGDIRTDWTLNKGWVPLYAQHKVLAGLIDAHTLAGKRAALPIARGLAAYMGGVFDALSDTQLQQVLSVEHGGLLESYADLHAITGEDRWLSLARRLRHRAVFDPLAAGQDRLSGLHANTQIPKLVGHARLHEIAGDPADARAASFFHDTVRRHHSYAIGGNSEREHFGKADHQGEQLTTATCEACNSYNMLKLTRHLYAWEPRGDWFDYYERTQLNHIMAHQRPDTGQFVYFMPLEAGAKRDYSKPEDSFWCCVGSGMESHAKHADSIYWQSVNTLFVNLFIPSTLDMPGGPRLELDTRYPSDGRVQLSLRRPPGTGQAIAIRRPAWADGASLRVNGEPVREVPRGGYWHLARRWKAGDRIELDLPMVLRAEPLAGAPSTYAFASGPLVLAADLGPATQRFDGAAPALLAPETPEAALTPIAGSTHHYGVTDVLGRQHVFAPFFPMYDRRTAVYFRTFTPTSWAEGRHDYLAAEAARADLARRTIDVFHIGEQQPEVDHALTASDGRAGEFYGRHNRTIPENSSVRFTLARRPGPALLQLTFWGRDVGRTLVIEVDEKPVATEPRDQPSVEDWVVRDYLLPPTEAASSVMTLTARAGDAVVYGVRSLEPRATSFRTRS